MWIHFVVCSDCVVVIFLTMIPAVRVRVLSGCQYAIRLDHMHCFHPTEHRGNYVGIIQII